MEKNWNRHKSIVNGHHMKHVQQTIDAEYKMPEVSGIEEKQRRERKYKSTVSKLPAIKKDKDILRKKTVYNPSMTYQGHKLITVSQPRITVEKKRLHVHQLSAKPSVTRAASETAESKNVLKSQQKEPRTPVKNEKQLKKKGVTNGAITNLNSIQHPYKEQEISDHVDHHDIASFSPLNSHELTEQPQISRRPSTFSEPEDIQTQRNMNEDDDRFDDNNLSYVSDIALPELVPISAQASNSSLHIDYTDSAEEDSNDSDEEHPSVPKQDMLRHVTSHGFDIVSTGNSSYFERNNVQSMQTSGMLHSPTVTETADQSPNSSRNLRDVVEVPRINESITLSQNSEISPNTNMQNHANHAQSPTILNSQGREIDSREYSTLQNAAAPLRLSMSSTAPNITLLRENLDLVFHTLSMQRQSERRNLENITPILLNKDDEKPKTDPEKLKKLQESLLQEDSEEEGDICRICLMGGETTENDLIAPCQCSGSLKYVHSECLKKWLLAKIKSGAELNTVRTCEMCKQTVECEIEGFNLSEHYRKHQETQATLNPSLYLVLLLHLYQQRYEEMLQLSQTQDRVSELSRRFFHLNLGRQENSRNNEQDS
ncbi:probable E3 ubiquitin-protein ligase MARCHF10 isoform X2 [Hyla sarda]|uniref:probable E3 ubiquitin-protein ligase MARCHF10 isoform X2 n=1 Tax=Hyla sarda TaxID=327740 RepID=UPI0024C23876|nr:probable E3 ubiquitin-protein ligase MARCHF10 isoform X2 [Hyla sarda]XP_056404521.1 probable E3 ubiquitin-protein ligase MARCHF10 isoform X2 [Hyla sarda]